MRKVLEASAIALLAVHLLYLWTSFQTLPETVPTHFNVAGEADAFGPKSSIWALWFVSLGLYTLLTAVVFIPLKSRLWNLPSAVKEASSGQQANAVYEMMAALKVLTVLIFLSLSWQTVRLAKSLASDWFIPLLLVAGVVAPLVIIGFYYARMNRTAVPR